MEYVASVEEALQMSDTSSTEWPQDERLPTELGARVSSKRLSSSLVAIQNLVKSFILKHSQLVCQAASLRDQNSHLRREVDRLQLELA